MEYTNSIHKKFVRYVNMILLISGFAFIVGSPAWFPDFYNLRFMIVVVFLSFGILAVVQLAINHYASDSESRYQFEKLQAILALGLLLNALGEFGLYRLYRVGFEYDKVTHFIFPLLSVFALSNFLTVFFKISPRRSAIISICALIATGIGWEIFEYVTDVVFNTTLFGIEGKFGKIDTIWDLTWDTVGSVIGGSLFLFRWKKNSLTHV